MLRNKYDVSTSFRLGDSSNFGGILEYYLAFSPLQHWGIFYSRSSALYRQEGGPFLSTSLSGHHYQEGAIGYYSSFTRRPYWDVYAGIGNGYTGNRVVNGGLHGLLLQNIFFSLLPASVKSTCAFASPTGFCCCTTVH